MKILLISQYFWPENMRINDLAVHLAKQGHNVTVLTGEPNYPNGSLLDDYKSNPELYNQYNGIKILRAPIITRGRSKLRLLINYASFFLSASFISAFKLKNQNFDLVFANQLSPITSVIPGIFVKKNNKIPLVIWILDLWPDTLADLDYFKKDGFIFRLMDRLSGWIYHETDLILVQSEAFKASIKRSCKEKKKVIFRPNWAESIFEKEFNKKLPFHKSSEDKGLQILFAGNIGAAQDIDSIIKAANILIKENKYHYWHIFGDGSEMNRLATLVKRNGLSSNFIFHGVYPLESMPFLFQSADVLLITLSAGEAFKKTIPGKLQSYMSSGKPILSMADGETNKIVMESKCGLTAPSGDYYSLAENVRKINSMTHNQREKMGESAKDYYNMYFHREIAMKNFEKILKQSVKDFHLE